MSEISTKKEAKLLAVKLVCPNGHLIYESQPVFYVWEESESPWDRTHYVKIQASCDACDLNERFFTLTVDG